MPSVEEAENTRKQNKKGKHKMKNTTKAVFAMLALGASGLLIIAQDTTAPASGDTTPPRHRRPDGPPPGFDGPGPQGGQGMHRPPPPIPPIIAALDTNHDGIIDAAEIANASAALMTLDKNGDGVLTIDELMPRPPPPFDGPGHPPGPPPPQGEGQNAPPTGN